MQIRIACVNYEPVSGYKDQGWSCERLGRYYNPGNVAEETCVFAWCDRDWEIAPTVKVIGFRSFRELSEKCKGFEPHVIRCYEAFSPYSEYALMLALESETPSYLSLHDMRVHHRRRLSGFDVITAYSETLAKKVSKTLNRKVEVQLNGVDSAVFESRFPSRIDPRVAEAQYRIFTIGRNDPVKNMDTVIKATQRLAAEMGSLAHVVAGPGTEKIIFDGVHLGLGPLTEDRIAEYMNWCSCFLQVQMVSDLGIAASEALMVGRPVVVTGDPSGNAQIHIDSSRGVLIPIQEAKNPQFITDALRLCLERHYDFMAIRQWAMELYDAEKLRREEAERYQRLISRDEKEAKTKFLKRISTGALLSSLYVGVKIRRVRQKWSLHRNVFRKIS